MKYTENDHRYALRKANKIKAINLLGGKCEICGEKNIIFLEFHHELNNKEDSISQILDYRWSDFEKEVSKCRLFCSNCHAEFHCKGKLGFGRRWKQKKKIMQIIGIDKCQKCGYHGKNFASMDFHHPNETNKKFSISKNITELKIIDILKETKKCTVICKNCHKLEHFDSKKFNSMKKLIDEKVKHHKEKTKPLDKAIVWKLYKSGKKQKEIKEYFGINNDGTISYILKLIKEGILSGKFKEKNNELIRSVCRRKKKKTNS